MTSETVMQNAKRRYIEKENKILDKFIPLAEKLHDELKYLCENGKDETRHIYITGLEIADESYVILSRSLAVSLMWYLERMLQLKDSKEKAMQLFIEFKAIHDTNSNLFSVYEEFVEMQNLSYEYVKHKKRQKFF